jgi:hypothetical protein
MPYASQAQAAYFHAHEAELEKLGVNVKEWDEASKGKKLPEKVKPKNAALSSK